MLGLTLVCVGARDGEHASPANLLKGYAAGLGKPVAALTGWAGNR
ncbi:MAG: hypothetical protein ABJA74_13165 [Lapillicoccus sp.]